MGISLAERYDLRAYDEVVQFGGLLAELGEGRLDSDPRS